MSNTAAEMRLHMTAEEARQRIILNRLEVQFVRPIARKLTTWALWRLRLLEAGQSTRLQLAYTPTSDTCK